MLWPHQVENLRVPSPAFCTVLRDNFRHGIFGNNASYDLSEGGGSRMMLK
jgi:hypothetical protein